MSGIDSAADRREATWYETTQVAAPDRATLTYDLDVDVCVIGGGLAGLTVAREMARRGWSVAVLEAQRIGSGASGRNAGFVSPGFAERPERIVERIGLAQARRLWALSQQGVDYVRETIRETGMRGVIPISGRLSVRRMDDAPGTAMAANLLRELGADVAVWPTAQVREVLHSERYFQALHLRSAFHIHPLNYLLGLAAAAEASGVRIFERTPVIGIDPDGVRKRITTPRARVRAGHIVLAASWGLAPLLPDISSTVLPVASYVAVTAPLGERLTGAITYRGAVADTRRGGDYYRIVAGDRLLWGGRITTTLTPPRRLTNLIRRDIAAVYPQLASVEITHAWTGVMGYALHRMPQIGEFAPGLWVASAFGGHGLNTTAMAGLLVARAIAEGDDSWREFAPYELVWAGGRLGRAVVQASYWSMQARDAIGERLARWRADRRSRRAAGEAQRPSQPQPPAPNAAQADTAREPLAAVAAAGAVAVQAEAATVAADPVPALPPEPAAPAEMPVTDRPEAVAETEPVPEPAAAEPAAEADLPPETQAAEPAPDTAVTPAGEGSPKRRRGPGKPRGRRKGGS